MPNSLVEVIDRKYIAAEPSSQLNNGYTTIAWECNYFKHKCIIYLIVCTEVISDMEGFTKNWLDSRV